MILAGKKILIVGLARTGIAAARFCAQKGAEVTVTDLRTEVELAGALRTLGRWPIRHELGAHRESTFTRQDLIVLSPGVPRTIPALAAAERAGVPVWAEIELAFRFIRAPILAVTGTNGKTTTVSLLGDVFRRAHQRVFVGGNIGEPLLGAAGGEWDAVVAEVSSFQLETIHTFAPHVGILLNVTPDHLDRYDSLESYAAAKERLFAFQTPHAYALLNADDRFAAGMAPRLRARVFFFSSSRPLDSGAFLDGETLVLRLHGGEERFDARPRKLLGRHNLENLLVTAACARLAGLPRGAVEGTIAGFEGLPHRLELVRTRNEVRFYNDSKATNVESVLRSLEAVPGPIRLIAGGRHKGASYAPLAPLVRDKVRALYVIGEAAALLEADLGGATRTERCGDLATAVRRAASDAEPGDAVLLSPACASYDQFHDYEERGDRFRALVEALP